MDHGDSSARPRTVGSTELGMAGAVQGREATANIGSGASFDGQLGPQLNDEVVPVHDNHGYPVRQHCPGAAGRGVVLVDLLPSGGGAVYNADYGLQLRQGAGHGEVFVRLLSGGGGVDAAYYNRAELARPVRAAARRGEVPVAVLHREPSPGVAYVNIGASWQQPGLLDAVLVGTQLPDGVVQMHSSSFYSALQPRPGAVPVDLLPGGGGAVYDGDYALQLRQGAGDGDVLVNLLPDGAGHGEAFVGLLPGGGVATVYEYDNYRYYEWQPRLGAGRGEVLIGPHPDGAGVVLDGSGFFAQQTHRAAGTRGADGIAGALRGRNLGERYGNRGMVAEHLRHLLPFVGIGASSVAVNGLAAGPGSPAIAFQLFVLLLGGLFLVILHVLRV